MAYRVNTVYDDGYVSTKDFDDKADAKMYFGNIDTTEITESVFSEITDDGEIVIDTKTTTKRK